MTNTFLKCSECDVDLKESLLRAARELDNGNPDKALDILRSVPLVQSDSSIRLVALALWKQITRANKDNSIYDNQGFDKVAIAFNYIALVVEDEKLIWYAYRALPDLENYLGAADAAAVVATVLWDRVLEAPEGIFAVTLELFFRGGVIERYDSSWKLFLAHRKDYVPNYWQFLMHAKALQAGNRAELLTEVKEYLHATDREDLTPLINVYFLKMRQADTREIFDSALTLTNSMHRLQVAKCIIGMGYMEEDLQNAVSIYRELAQGTILDQSAIEMMDARLANSERRWSDVISHGHKACANPAYRYTADLLCANALANLKQTDDARKKLETVTTSSNVTPFLKARAVFISVTVELIEKKVPLPDSKQISIKQDVPGRPLAQSLWVGPRLRWIERLAIKSYLSNGWRFQLYVYEMPDNVPEGCEILDANVIIPHREVFREGQKSGLHAGSVGAFSDLFRYKLLHLRGGLWTDTDVINFQKYDPDGERFISTEISDAGLITLNGAIMAAPAGDEFVARAYERASELLRSDDMFFTRIGPYLLAELVCEIGAENINLMPPKFLSTVYWMNTATLLKPYDEVMKRPEMDSLINLHIYTEMWRMLGLGLEKPPGTEIFLGRLYAEHFPDEYDELKISSQ